MENYGHIFRELRKQRQLSLKEVADDKVSISQLSRFERGESDITLSKLLHLLNKIKIIPTEFFYRINAYGGNQQIELMKRMRELIFTQDLTTFKEIIDDLESKVKSDPNDIQSKLNLVLFEGILCEHDDKRVFKEEYLTFLYDHLFTTEVWGIEELITLGNLYRYLDFDSLEGFVAEILERHYFYHVGSYLNIVEALLLNIIELTIEKGMYTKSQYYIDKLEPILSGEHKAYHRIILTYQKGFLSYAQGNQSGKEMMANAIMCFEITESHYHAGYFKKHFEKWTD